MFYISLDSPYPAFPVDCRFELKLRDPAQPELECALLRLANAPLYLCDRIVFAAKSGFDVTPRHSDDAALVYAFAPPPNLDNGHVSLELWSSCVEDWGVITTTRKKAMELLPRDA